MFCGPLVHWRHRRGRQNFCLQKSRMPLAGLVYLDLHVSLQQIVEDFTERRVSAISPVTMRCQTSQEQTNWQTIGYSMSGTVHRTFDRQLYYQNKKLWLVTRLFSIKRASIFSNGFQNQNNVLISAVWNLNKQNRKSVGFWKLLSLPPICLDMMENVVETNFHMLGDCIIKKCLRPMDFEIRTSMWP